MMRIAVGIMLMMACIACRDGKSDQKKEDMQVENKEKSFQAISPKEIDDNFIRLIGDQWMLVTAGDSAKFNTMTASWGCAGFLWNKPVVFIFIRPQRYTFGFLEENKDFTLSFFDEKYRDALKICGSVSGRDVNKMEKTGLTPRFTAGGNVAFEEARLILECRKIYGEFLNPEAFIDPEIFEKVYGQEEGVHKVFVAEIVHVWEKK